MEIIIALVAICVAGWFFFVRKPQKSTPIVDNTSGVPSYAQAPYKVEEPAPVVEEVKVETPAAEPAPVKAARKPRTPKAPAAEKKPAAKKAAAKKPAAKKPAARSVVKSKKA